MTVTYEWLVPNHVVWALVVPWAIGSWLRGTPIEPPSLEFWLLAYFGFYRKLWPSLSTWIATYAAV